MSLFLTTPPAVEPLSLAEAKAHLRVPHIDDDAYISTLITSARCRVEKRTGLRLITQNWSQFMDSWSPFGVVDLAINPVTAVTDIIVFGDTDTASPIDPAHYFLDATSNPPRVVFREGRSPSPPGRRAKGIEIRLVAGFGLAADVPPELKHAIMLLVADAFAHRGDDNQRPMTPVVSELINAYRVMRLT